MGAVKNLSLSRSELLVAVAELFGSPSVGELSGSLSVDKVSGDISAVVCAAKGMVDTVLDHVKITN